MVRRRGPRLTLAEKTELWRRWRRRGLWVADSTDPDRSLSPDRPARTTGCSQPSTRFPAPGTGRSLGWEWRSPVRVHDGE